MHKKTTSVIETQVIGVYCVHKSCLPDRIFNPIVTEVGSVTILFG